MSRPVALAYRALGLGDFLCGIPALRALRDAFPGHELVLAAPRALAPLAELTGAVDTVLDTTPLAPPTVAGVDVAVNLHGRGPQSTALLRALRPRRLIAFGETAGWRADEHEVHRWCRLLDEAGIPADPARLALLGHEAASWPTGDEAVSWPPLVVHPGAASGARRWPAERWAAVARALAEQGERVVVTGSPDERPLGEGVARAAGLPGDAVLAGRTDLLELAELVAGAARVYCGDTGLAHLATATGTPSVVLFGPTPPAEWGPPPDRPRHVVLYKGDGRRGDPHGTEPDPALLAVTVADVMAVTGARVAA